MPYYDDGYGGGHWDDEPEESDDALDDYLSAVDAERERDDKERMAVIGVDLFGSHANAYINDYVIEINLPQWSGRIHSRENALTELAKLKQLIADIETDIKRRSPEISQVNDE